ncbi:MAG: amino acid ABC transporter substrate-binding protein [Phyllobacteriaceae bacterium]|nr:amino acid ABC transporter substrate-binding protein [Phyllobacteriaceae bacterium]
MSLFSKFAGIAAAVLVTTTAVQAQLLPQQLQTQEREVQGNKIRACVDDYSAGGKLDRAIAQAIGDALFLEVEYKEALRGFPLDGDGYLAELQIQLNNDCDLFMGVVVQPNMPFPDWASITRPYAEVPFVLVTDKPDYNSLADIPYGLTIGTSLASLGERVFATSVAQRPQDQRWKRLPYADFELMTLRMREDKLAAMLLWQPSLLQLAETDPSVADLRIISLDPVPQAVVPVGALVSTRNTFLRTQVDNAIAELTADGTIDQIMADLGVMGSAPR